MIVWKCVNTGEPEDTSISKNCVDEPLSTNISVERLLGFFHKKERTPAGSSPLVLPEIAVALVTIDSRTSIEPSRLSLKLSQEDTALREPLIGLNSVLSPLWKFFTSRFALDWLIFYSPLSRHILTDIVLCFLYACVQPFKNLGNLTPTLPVNLSERTLVDCHTYS